MLKGSRLIVLHHLQAMLTASEKPTVAELAARSGYSARTVKRALHALRAEGYITYTSTRNPQYTVTAPC